MPQYRSKQSSYANPTTSSAIKSSLVTEDKRKKDSRSEPIVNLNIDISKSGRNARNPGVGEGRFHFDLNVNIPLLSGGCASDLTNKPYNKHKYSDHDRSAPERATKDQMGMGHVVNTKHTIPKAAHKVRLSPEGDSVRSVPSDRNFSGSSRFHDTPRLLSHSLSDRNSGRRTYTNRDTVNTDARGRAIFSSLDDTTAGTPRYASSYNEQNKRKDTEVRVWSYSPNPVTDDYSSLYPGTGDYSTRYLGTDDYSTRYPGTGDYSTRYPGTGDYSTRYPGTDDYSTRYPGTGDYSSLYPGTGDYSTRYPGTDDYSTRYTGTGDYSRFSGDSFEGYEKAKLSGLQHDPLLTQNKDFKYSTGVGANFNSHDAEKIYQRQVSKYADNKPSRDSAIGIDEGRNAFDMQYFKPCSRSGNEEDEVVVKPQQPGTSVETCAAMYKTRDDPVERLLDETVGDKSKGLLLLEEKEKEKNKGEKNCIRIENAPETNDKRASGSGQAKAGNKREPVVKEDGKGARPKQKQTNIKPRGGDQDDSPYRKYDHRQREWRRDEDIAKQSLNLKFYKNELSSKPWGNKIEEMLTWKGDYRKLESNHSYIQWLFPTQDYSMINSYAQPIQFHEAEEIRESPELRFRFLSAYVMMLDFYGMTLKSEDTGAVERSKNWRDRFRHLNRSSHNFYRITRILIALGVFGFEHFQEPWLLFLMKERFKYKTLPDIPFGVLHHWIGSVNNEDARTRVMIEFTELSDGVDGRDRPRSAWNQHRSSARASKDVTKRHEEMKLKDMIPREHQSEDEMDCEGTMNEHGGAGLDSHDNEKMQQLNISKQDGGSSAAGDLIDVGGAAASPDNVKIEFIRKPALPESGGCDDSLGQSLVQRETNTRNNVTRDRPVETLQSQSSVEVEGVGCEPDKKMRDSQRSQQVPDESDKGKAGSVKTDSMRNEHHEYGRRREHYQPKDEGEVHNSNLMFYKNEIESRPDGYTIEEMLKWHGDYPTIETYIGYITWLFPTQEGSMSNPYAQPLEFHEADIIRETPVLRSRFLRAYEMMLDFFGMELKSEAYGTVDRSNNCRERFNYINRSSSNAHRMITRIIMALGTFGFEHFQAQLLGFIMEEVFVHKRLVGIDGLVMNIWIDAMNREEDKTKMAIKLTRFSES